MIGFLIDLYHRLVGPDKAIAAILNATGRIEVSLASLTEQGVSTMATLDDILNDEAQEAQAVGQLATAVQTLLADNADLKKQIADLIAGALPPEVQAKVDAAFAASDGNVKSVQGVLASLAPPPAPIQTPAP